MMSAAAAPATPGQQFLLRQNSTSSTEEDDRSGNPSANRQLKSRFVQDLMLSTLMSNNLRLNDDAEKSDSDDDGQS